MRGGTACARTAGVARRPARRLHGMPALIPPCVRGCPSRSSGSAWVRGVPRQADKARRGIPSCHASFRAPLLPVQRGGGGVPLCHSCSGVCAARGASVPSAGVAVTVRPVMSEQRCSGFLRRAVHMCSGERTGTTGPMRYCFCFRASAQLHGSPSSRPSSGRADASRHKLTGPGGNCIFGGGHSSLGPLPRAARRRGQRGAGQWAPAGATPGVQPPTAPPPAAARSAGSAWGRAPPHSGAALKQLRGWPDGSSLFL